MIVIYTKQNIAWFTFVKIILLSIFFHYNQKIPAVSLKLITLLNIVSGENIRKSVMKIENEMFGELVIGHCFLMSKEIKAYREKLAFPLCFI